MQDVPTCLRQAGRCRAAAVRVTGPLAVRDLTLPQAVNTQQGGPLGDNQPMMIRVWEYDVTESAATDFERVYGAEGAWAQLFSSSDGFESTELFVSVSNSARYLTVDRFRDQASWRRFQAEHRDAYLALDRESESLTNAERELVEAEVD